MFVFVLCCVWFVSLYLCCKIWSTVPWTPTSFRFSSRWITSTWVLANTLYSVIHTAAHFGTRKLTTCGHWGWSQTRFVTSSVVLLGPQIEEGAAKCTWSSQSPLAAPSSLVVSRPLMQKPWIFSVSFKSFVIAGCTKHYFCLPLTPP